MTDDPRRRHRARTDPLRPRPAAGLLLRYTDNEGAWYLLGKRHRRLGGTWANIGGSLKRGEAPLAGAIREFHEELAVDVAGLGATIADVIECGDSAVPYTLFVLDVPTWFDDAELSWENDQLCWWHADEIGALALHAGFARAWATLHPSTFACVAAPAPNLPKGRPSHARMN